MKTRIALMVLGAVLLFAGTAGAQALQPQTLLPGLQIPQFVSELPLGGTSITLVNATSFDIGPLISATSGKASATPYPIRAESFQAQILPTPDQFVAAGFTVPPLCGASTDSNVWGYRTDDDVVAPGGVRDSYLGPVVLAQKAVAFYPKYENNLPIGGSIVQQNMPIDMTLDWADPLAPAYDCLPDALGNWTNPVCGGNPWPPYPGPIPIATHLHGGEVAPAYDGGPDAWFTPDVSPADGFPDITGAGFPTALGQGVYEYPNEQQEGTIWFHDHALGITRLNVFAGLAGLYPILDYVSDGVGGWTPGPTAPRATAIMPDFPAYDIPLIIQDRSFDDTCEIFYNLASNPQPNPTVHPFWIPEFIGDTIVVNGKTWPRLQVEPRKYRFRLVNGSNARFYDLSLTYPVAGTVQKGKKKTRPIVINTPVLMTVIATDDGYLNSAVSTPNLIIGPGERYEIIVDFGQPIPANAKITMMNAARTPFPAGAAPVVGLTDRVMQFWVTKPLAGPDLSNIVPGTPIRKTNIEDIKMGHDTFSGALPPGTGSITRQLTLNEVIGPGGPLELVVNNSKFNNPYPDPNCGGGGAQCRFTEFPTVGDTEIWEIINITADAHPMHTHLVSFKLIDRTPIPKVQRWINNYDGLLKKNLVLPGFGPPNPYHVRNADGAIGGNPPVWNGPRPAGLPPLNSENGWKDTVITYPGEVTRIAVRWATTDTPVDPLLVGTNTYPFDPTVLQGGVGYVWHCHIIDHEDNEMMRNYVVLPGPARQIYN